MRNGHSFPSSDEEEEFLTDALDHEILMQRDAHFGGDFEVMLNYYQNEKHIGIQADIDLERISYLAEVEKELGNNLASLILTGAETERVGRARRAYEQLKEVYEVEEESTPLPRLIADLILTEIEEPEDEIEAVVAQGEESVPNLIALLNSADAFDPLFPGYGYAPYLAIICLGKIGDPRALIPLFETLGKEGLFQEDAILDALNEIGEPARDFLLSLIESRPLTTDNTQAAFALTAFPNDEKVALSCFEQLLDPAVRRNPLLSTYLLCSCDALQHTPYRSRFIELSQDPEWDEELRQEMQLIISDWVTP